MPPPPPPLSVLLPARDAEATVERAVQSILGQTLGDFELLALDDGSKDGTRSVLERLARSDARIRLLDAGGRGLVHALNLGLSHARAPLIARMDADDESLPERLRGAAGGALVGPGAVGRGHPGGDLSRGPAGEPEPEGLRGAGSTRW